METVRRRRGGRQERNIKAPLLFCSRCCDAIGGRENVSSLPLLVMLRGGAEMKVGDVSKYYFVTSSFVERCPALQEPVSCHYCGSKAEMYPLINGFTFFSRLPFEFFFVHFGVLR